MYEAFCGSLSVMVPTANQSEICKAYLVSVNSCVYEVPLQCLLQRACVTPPVGCLPECGYSDLPHAEHGQQVRAAE